MVAAGNLAYAYANIAIIALSVVICWPLMYAYYKLRHTFAIASTAPRVSSVCRSVLVAVSCAHSERVPGL